MIAWLSNLSHFVPVGIATGGLFFLYKWFLLATDISVRYNWSFNGTMERPNTIRPNLQIRNHSKSKSYVLGGIEYRIGRKRPPIHIDNESLWGTESKAGTIQHFTVRPVSKIQTLSQAFGMEVSIQLQSGRRYWLKAQGPNQKYPRLQCAAFWVREKLSRSRNPAGLRIKPGFADTQTMSFWPYRRMTE